MQNSLHLMRARRFVPLFATQALGAFNDSLFKQAVVLFVTYQLYSDATKEFQFSAIAQGLFILPFFLFSALAGQLADDHDKAKLIRIIKTAEIGIMLVGAAGILLASIPLMLAAVFAMGVHSTFFGPIKYAILPQHLERDEVLGGTGLVEAGTYLAILFGTILAGVLAARSQVAAIAVIGFAFLGLLAGRQVPPAPPQAERMQINWHIVRASIQLVSATMHIRRLFLAILAISFFWAIGAVLIIIFPPLVKNVLGADEQVASLFIAIFSIGIAIGSVLINRLLKSEVSARYAPASVVVMGGFVLMLHFIALAWGKHAQELTTLGNFLSHPSAGLMIAALLGVAISGGMFVVPLYAFLTTTVPKAETARTVAANNIVNSGAMVIGSGLAFALSSAGVGPTGQLVLVAAMCLVSAWLGYKLHLACD
ncbi:MFS transporter [Sphingomonas ginkgonis]|uniref:MFS transporter n=1 Tax=Sphingomonas ginkgonis TaxID=2315330 RepID=A0A3R9YL14_9SPHN|nr:MFS transporter [Sphingomonas ginkgonis]RST32225.1 MFS transporter [Sphingomonas ginkgonis]